jgi:hypothetical protein
VLEQSHLSAKVIVLSSSTVDPVESVQSKRSVYFDRFSKSCFKRLQNAFSNRILSSHLQYDKIHCALTK